MKHAELKAWAGEVGSLVRNYVERGVAPLLARLEALEQREVPPSRDALLAAMGELVAVNVAREVARVDARVAQVEARAPVPGPPGEPGEPGTAGKDGVDGVGVNGKDGRDGIDGKSVTLEELVPALLPPLETRLGAFELEVERRVQARVERVLASLPAPRDGRDGVNGRDGKDGVDGKAGRDGVDGKDGVGINGKDGRDGVDGVGFDDLTVDYDGERSLVLRFTRGAHVREFPLVLPVLIERGVWHAARYARGDTVSHGGSIWIAQKDTDAEAKPGDSDQWRLAVKKGRDGRDGAKGDKGEPGTAGRPGRDLTNLGADGSKWS